MSLFFLFLGIAAWQDLRTRSISLEVLRVRQQGWLFVCWKAVDLKKLFRR